MVHCGPLFVGGCGLLLLLCAGLRAEEGGVEEYIWWQTRAYCEKNGGFYCDNKNCIYAMDRCDGKDTCGDNSDERDCGKYQCGDNRWRCPYSDQCIALWQVCDDTKDCNNGLDEKVTFCQDVKWRETQCTGENAEYTFWCPTAKKCIPIQFRCNGFDNCGGDDELDCAPIQCLDGFVKCGSTGHCIYDSMLCDGNNDCGDNWDEENCIAQTCSELSSFRCANGICRSNFERCNGKDDCGDNSDEANCETCPPFWVKCRNGNCAHYWQLCNDMNDCGDDSDETHDLCDAKKK